MTGNVKIHKSLLPLSWIYGAGVCFRNKLFDSGILPVEKFGVPILSIGNLRVGGTGKTPHTEYLIRLLGNNYRLAILSRGYKRKSKGFILADSSADSSRIGDESYQLFRKFPHILVAVDSNRRRGIRNLLNLSEKIRPEIILMDDAYQHRYVKPSLSILLTEYAQPFSRDYLLPAGRLREPAENKNRADIIIVTKCPDFPDPENRDKFSVELKPEASQELFFSRFSYGPLCPASKTNQEIDAKRAKEEISSALLFTGIASPLPLIDHIQSLIPKVEIQTYPDHHNYTSTDFRDLDSRFNRLPGEEKILITTEKDIVKLVDDPDFPKELREHLYYIPIEVQFETSQKELFNKIIENHVKTIERNRSLA